MKDHLTVLSLRHGHVHVPIERQGNFYGLLPGFGLSDTGRQQAQAVAGSLRDLPIRAIYCSPLQRAVETSQIVGAAFDIHVQEDDRLYEWRFWDSVGGKESTDEVRVQIEEMRTRLLRHPNDTSAGESLIELQTRLASWLREIKDTFDSGIVVAVSHIDAIRAVLFDVLSLPIDTWGDIDIGYGQVVRLHPDPQPGPLISQL